MPRIYILLLTFLICVPAFAYRLPVDSLSRARHLADTTAKRPARHDSIPKSATKPTSKSDSKPKNTVDSIADIPTIDLGELVVTGTKAAVVAKEDTLEFNAGSFKTQPNAVVEDLLKKLPGVEVGSDGTIKSNGKTVKKVLVDGKEFFGEDTKMATKNLPSELVDKVQVVDRKSDFARMTGVDDGEEETVINLTVKKSMHNGWFGTLQAGYGTDRRYEGSFNISRFNDANQFSIIGGANNINELGFMDGGRGRFMSFGPSGGINNSQRIGINFSIGKTEKLRFGGNVFYTHSDRKSESATDTQYLFADSVSTRSQAALARDRGHNVSADFRLEWKPDEYNSLDFRPNLSFNARHSEMNDTSLLRAGDLLKTLVNHNDNRTFNHGTSWNAGGTLIYNHKFAARRGRSFSVRASYSFSNTRQRTTSWNDIIYYLQQDDSETLYQYIENKQWNNMVRGTLTWTEPLGDSTNGNFLQLSYNAQVRFNNADKSTYNLPLMDLPEDLDRLPADGIIDLNLSNRFRNRFFNQELKVGFKRVTRKMNLDVGLAFAPSSSKSTDLINPDRNIPTRWVWNVAPYARLRFKFNKNQALRVHYNARTSQPSISQLQPVVDKSDPLNIVVGNPSLKPTFTQGLRFFYNNYAEERQQAFNAMLNAEYSTNVVVARTVTDPNTGGRTTTYANANGNMSLFGGFMLNQPFRNRKWRYSAMLNVSYSSNAGYINGDFNRTGNLNLRPELGLTFSSDVFQMTLRPTYSFGMTHNTLESQDNRYTNTYGFYTDASLYLPFGLTLTTDLRYDKSTGFSQGFDNDSWLWNAQLSYSMLHDKSLTFSVRAYDILAMKNNVTRSISANQIIDSRTNDLTRYVMFGVSYTFNTMKNRKPNGNPPGMGDFGGDHPRPPRGAMPPGGMPGRGPR